MPRPIVQVTCRGCGKVTQFAPEALSPFEERKLKCSSCGARDPLVEDAEVRQPYEIGYQPGGGNVVVFPARRVR